MDKKQEKKYIEMQTIGEIIGETVKKKILHEAVRNQRNDFIQKTKARIRSYPQLKRNIERYKLDIEDIKSENFGKSKSIVIMQPTYANPLALEEKRAASILIVEKKIERDRREIKYIELALAELKKDSYYLAFEKYFFQNMSFDEIAEQIYKSRSAVSRNVGRMVNQVALFCYGADVFS